MDCRSEAGLQGQAHFGRESRINQPNHCCPVPSEVVLARPIHGLLRNRAAILAVEN
jgi:hypothetical protein